VRACVCLCVYVSVCLRPCVFADPGKAFLKVAEGIESSITGRPPPAEGEDSKLRRGLKALNLDTTAVLAQSKDAVHTGKFPYFTLTD
jgi:hypothetical protein